MGSIQVAPSGDLTILLSSPANSSNKRRKSSSRTQNASSKDVQQTYIVSSAVMRLASPVWEKMLDPQGHFRESFSNGEVQFVEDDAAALLLILRIAHLQFREVPKVLHFQELVNLAVVCDKYDTAGLARPWIKQWETSLNFSIEEPGCEEYLFFAWTFGDLSSYEKIAKRLIYESTCDSKGQYTADGNLLGMNLPPGSLECILETREKAIVALLETCSKLVERYESDRMLCQAHNSQAVGRQCDTLMYGCLIKGLKKLRLWPGPISPGDVHVSLTVLVDSLYSMPCLVLDGKRATAHAECTFTEYFREKIDSIEFEISSGTDVPLRKHMEEQAKK